LPESRKASGSAIQVSRKTEVWQSELEFVSVVLGVFLPASRLLAWFIFAGIFAWAGQNDTVYPKFSCYIGRVNVK
jgi:hypothetical protein